jgi:hypothetical protein
MPQEGGVYCMPQEGGAGGREGEGEQQGQQEPSCTAADDSTDSTPALQQQQVHWATTGLRGVRIDRIPTRCGK